jgi:hypothetical protein
MTQHIVTTLAHEAMRDSILDMRRACRATVKAARVANMCNARSTAENLDVALRRIRAALADMNLALADYEQKYGQPGLQWARVGEIVTEEGDFPCCAN